MQTRIGAWTRALTCAAVLAALLSGGSAQAASSKVVRVEVSASQAHQEPALAHEFERVVRREVSRLSLAPGRKGRRYVLAATLVELKTQSRQDLATATCRVSFTVRDQRGGRMRAILRGRARASNAKSRAFRLRSEAMQAAVHSALSRLPSVLN